MTNLGLAALALATFGCQAADGAHDNVVDTARSGGAMVSESEAKAAFDNVVVDFASGDAFKVMSHYAPNAVLFDAGRARPSTDRNEQTQWTAQFMTMKPADFTTSDFHLQPIDATHFLASGIQAFTANAGPGRSVLHVRFSQLFEKQANGQWMIIHEHISGMPAEAGAPPA